MNTRVKNGLPIVLARLIEERKANTRQQIYWRGNAITPEELATIIGEKSAKAMIDQATDNYATKGYNYFSDGYNLVISTNHK